MKNTTQGFTLIELLIVIAIIGILAAVLIPNLLGAQKRAYDTGSQACAKSIQTAEASYFVDKQSYVVAITREGVDKAYGLKKLRDASGIALDAMMFIGDAIFPGGNDYPAKQLGLDTVRVRDPQDTLGVIAAIVACQKD